jgi:tRNA threonylcarbamoyladenosine biosynthesis protein TsaB
VTRIAALDTTGESGSLALVEDGVTIEELPLHAPDGFGHVLFPELQRLMERHGWRFDSVTGFAAASGPGSFTGVRIGLAAVKGLAEVCGVRAAAVSTLEAIAAFGTAAVRAPIFDARRGEIYGGLYDSALQPLARETVAPYPEWLAGLPPEAQLLSPDPAPFEGPRPITATPRALAAKVALIGARRLADPAALDANYVRRSDAELHWREAR